MIGSGHCRGPLVALLLVAAGSLPGRADDCVVLVESFNKAVDTGRETDAQRLVDTIATDPNCGRLQVAAQRRLAAFRLAAVQFLTARGRPAADYERFLLEADRPEVLWQASATLGEVRFGQRRFADAAMAFDRAIEIMKNETLTPTGPTKFEVERMVDRAAQSRLLAANAEPGQGGGKFVKTARNDRDGKLGGVYSPSVRGVIPRAVPVPITFEYAKTDFTSIGDEAARELLTAVKEQQPARIVLIGHTDIRGALETNLKLSRARADAVAQFLRTNGIEIPVETVGKGASEPMKISDTSGLTQEDIYALNRRVEWRRE